MVGRQGCVELGKGAWGAHVHGALWWGGGIIEGRCGLPRSLQPSTLWSWQSSASI